MSSRESSVFFLLSVYLQTTRSTELYVLTRHTNHSGGSTADPAKQTRSAKVSQEMPALAIAAEGPCLYILPADLPSSRTPLVTPHRAPARHQPHAIRFFTLQSWSRRIERACYDVKRQAGGMRLPDMSQEYCMRTKRAEVVGALLCVCAGIASYGSPGG